MFGTAPMRALFADEALVERYLEVEAALARAQAQLGLIPAEAGAAISAAAARGRAMIDLPALKRETELVGYPIVALVRQLAAAAGPEAGGYVHWGATTQDIMDCATVLQLRAALGLIEAELAALRAILADLAARHRDTLMPGRTHLQHALPVTFGYKVAIWLAALDRHAERLAQLRPRVELVQFGGAAGTLASLGAEAGLATRRKLARELGLGEADITWHVARDGLAEAVGLLALIGGTLGKAAYDIMLMMMNELAEAFEPFAPGRGASSTMPQKFNPICCEAMLACARMLRSRAGEMLDAMVADFERATGPWHIEWVALPEAFIMAAGSLAQARFLFAGLAVQPARMRANLDLTGGLIVAEAAMMALAPHTGRGEAHEIVYGACRRAVAERRPLAALLAETPEAVAHLSPEAIAVALDPANYVGAAPVMVDRVLARHPRPRPDKAGETP